jgi:hypothetical protein
LRRLSLQRHRASEDGRWPPVGARMGAGRIAGDPRGELAVGAGRDGGAMAVGECRGQRSRGGGPTPVVPPMSCRTAISSCTYRSSTASEICRLGRRGKPRAEQGAGRRAALSNRRAASRRHQLMLHPSRGKGARDPDAAADGPPSCDLNIERSLGVIWRRGEGWEGPRGGAREGVQLRRDHGEGGPEERDRRRGDILVCALLETTIFAPVMQTLWTRQIHKCLSRFASTCWTWIRTKQAMFFSHLVVLQSHMTVGV